MTTNVSIVFPNQIFENNPCIDKHRRIFIVEDDLFFNYQKFHKMKLILHRASMKFYADYLSNKGYRVTYIDFDDYYDLTKFFRKNFSDESVEELHYCDLVDDYLEQRVNKAAKECNLKLVSYKSPSFLNDKVENEEFLGKEKSNYKQADFYKKIRLKYDYLIEFGEPKNGKWSFDESNRKSLPSNYKASYPNFPIENQYVNKAKEYIEKNYPNNPGNVSPFLYPVTFEDAKSFLQDFFNFRFNDFGPFQDALSDEQPFVNHSLLSSSLNCGLLTPDFVVNEAIKYAENENIRFSSLEGFVRQIIGWREFVRAIYERHGRKERTSNFWKAENKIDGSVLSEIQPLAAVHKKVEKFAYAHHIERLMVLGNFFTLAEIHPDEIYNYFMQYYIDAYDWVMVPNVYGMSTYADGGLMSTKPYISSSNYLLKMGANKKGGWTKTWDGLYWRFLFKNKAFFENNHRTKMMTFHLNKMSEQKLKSHLENANNFLKLLS